MRLRYFSMSSLLSSACLFSFTVLGAWLWADEFRKWTDATGKFTISAKLVEEKDGKVLLKKQDGSEVTLPVERLSAKDQKYLASQNGSGPEKSNADKSKSTSNQATDQKDVPRLREMAEKFYADLRSETRPVAREMLTDAAKSLVDDGASALVGLPAPDASPKAIRIGRAKVTGKSAEVTVTMLVKGDGLRTSLHLRKVDDQWQVFGMSAKIAGEEVTVNLETRFEKPSPSEPKSRPRESLDALVGKPIELSGVTLNGKAVSLAQLKGKVVLIDFWATWRGPCRAEIPNIAANYQHYKNSGFEVIAVSVDKDLEELAEFVTQESPPWIVLADAHPRNPTSMASKFGISGIPAFVLVDKDGTVAAVNCRGEKLGQALAKLLP